MKNATPKKKEPPQTTKKVLKVLEDFMYSPFFVNKIIEMRQKHRIPKDGFEITEDEYIILSEEECFLFLPTQLLTKDKKINNNLAQKIRQEIQENILKGHIEPITIFTPSIIAYYLFFNTISFNWNEKITEFYNRYGLQEVVDFEWFEESTGTPKDLFNEKPVGILLHPEITKNDLISFIDKHFESEIKPLLKQHIKTSLYKNKKVKNNPKTSKIKEIISKSQGKSLREISKELGKHKIHIDKQHIVKVKKEIDKKY